VLGGLVTGGVVSLQFWILFSVLDTGIETNTIKTYPGRRFKYRSRFAAWPRAKLGSLRRCERETFSYLAFKSIATLNGLNI